MLLLHYKDSVASYANLEWMNERMQEKTAALAVYEGILPPVRVIYKGEKGVSIVGLLYATVKLIQLTEDHLICSVFFVNLFWPLIGIIVIE